MSEGVPREVIRKIRQMQDTAMDYAGVNAVLYRNKNELSDKDTSANRFQDFYEDQGDLSESRVIYDDPVVTTCYVKWPEDLKITDLFRLNVDEDVDIPGNIKYEDYVTINSYYKIPFSVVTTENQGEDISKPGSEGDRVIRLNVNRIVTEGVDNSGRIEVRFGIKRTKDDLAESDTSPSADTPSDFFSD